MATPVFRALHRLGGLRPAGRHLRAAAVVAIVLLVPLAGSVAILSLKQVVPRQSYPGDSHGCDRLTAAAFRAGAPSPLFVPVGDRCEIADYPRFVRQATRYNLRRGVAVGAFTLVSMAALLFGVLRRRR
ncbi:hypothetical protein GN316_00555 [Xylophilus sp. Kf1]|nr:hypothetical protein [Xylophilus sp. Kf1]